MEKERKWSVEYSISQDCFHVDDLDCVIQRNLQRVFEKGGADYKIIGIFNTQDEACEYAKVCRKKLEEYNGNDIEQK